MSIRCLRISNGEISGIPQGFSLETLDGEEIMVCDYDAISSGKLSFKLYGQIAKFFELTVVNFPGRIEDLMDSLISGAYRVVLHPEEKPEIIAKMLEVSDNIVLPARSSNLDYFLNKGGKFIISDREDFHRFDLCYNVGFPLSSEKYVNVSDFPENLLHYI